MQTHRHTHAPTQNMSAPKSQVLLSLIFMLNPQSLVTSNLSSACDKEGRKKRSEREREKSELKERKRRWKMDGEEGGTNSIEETGENRSPTVSAR